MVSAAAVAVPVAFLLIGLILVLVLVVFKGGSSGRTPTPTDTPSPSTQQLQHEAQRQEMQTSSMHDRVAVSGRQDGFGSAVRRLVEPRRWAVHTDTSTMHYDDRALMETHEGFHWRGRTLKNGVLSDREGEIAYDPEAVRIIADSPLTLVCRDGIRVVLDNSLRPIVQNVRVRDAYVSGDWLVVLSEHEVLWFKSGVAVARVASRGMSLCEISGDECLVGVPREERVLRYRLGAVEQEILYQAEPGASEFGHAVTAFGDRAVITAPGEGGGHAYVYELLAGVWVFSKRIGGDASAGPRVRFGQSAALLSHGKVAVGYAHANRVDLVALE
jgi:hypothetical protein